MNKYSKFFKSGMSSNEARLKLFTMINRIPKAERGELNEAYLEAKKEIAKRERVENAGYLTE
ncbi:MAG: hypothetical protein K5886_02760 [Lachnospiraceae bacterium]|nr:hypothetical protein [Lachnospiraceae bacterium]